MDATTEEAIEEFAHTNLAWAEVFQIFAKYEEKASVCPAHDEIWAGPEAGLVSEEDLARLNQLGWTTSIEGGFHRFV